MKMANATGMGTQGLGTLGGVGVGETVEVGTTREA